MLLKYHLFEYMGKGRFHVTNKYIGTHFIINREQFLYYLSGEDPNYDFSTRIPENHRLYSSGYTELELSDMLIVELVNYCNYLFTNIKKTQMEHSLKKSEKKIQESFKLAGDWVVFRYLLISIFQLKELLKKY